MVWLLKVIGFCHLILLDNTETLKKWMVGKQKLIGKKSSFCPVLGQILGEGEIL